MLQNLEKKEDIHGKTGYTVHSNTGKVLKNTTMQRPHTYIQGTYGNNCIEGT